MKNNMTKVVVGLVLLLVILLGVWFVVGRPPAEEAEEKLDFFLSFHDPTAPWGYPMKTATQDAAREFGINVSFIGPTPPDPVEQLEQIKTLIEQDILDGLAVAPLDAETFRPFIDELIDKGIPVVTLTTDSPESKRLAFFVQRSNCIISLRVRILAYENV